MNDDFKTARLNESLVLRLQMREAQEQYARLEEHWERQLSPELVQLSPWQVGEVIERESDRKQFLIMEVLPQMPEEDDTDFAFWYDIAPLKKDGRASKNANERVFPLQMKNYRKAGAQ